MTCKSFEVLAPNPPFQPIHQNVSDLPDFLLTKQKKKIERTSTNISDRKLSVKDIQTQSLSSHKRIKVS